MSDEDTRTRQDNNISGTQNIVSGDQYNSARDHYVNYTFIGVTYLPLTDEQQAKPGRREYLQGTAGCGGLARD